MDLKIIADWRSMYQGSKAGEADWDVFLECFAFGKREGMMYLGYL